jgi:hypothetical protein
MLFAIASFVVHSKMVYLYTCLTGQFQCQDQQIHFDLLLETNGRYKFDKTKCKQSELSRVFGGHTSQTSDMLSITRIAKDEIQSVAKDTSDQNRKTQQSNALVLSCCADLRSPADAFGKVYSWRGVNSPPPLQENIPSPRYLRGWRGLLACKNAIQSQQSSPIKKADCNKTFIAREP